MQPIEQILRKYQSQFHPVVEFDAKKNKLHVFDFTETNTTLHLSDITDTGKLSQHVNNMLEKHQAIYGIGGYNENRVLYKSSSLFDGEQPRTIHLGIDIWGPANTKVYAPLGGMVHSFAFNNAWRDYGATIILLHQLDTISFYTLYGHLSLNDIAQLQEGNYVNRGQVIGHFGVPEENGNWPPHLHFQIIKEINFQEGDYPGVCTLSEQENYLENCPDPDLILNMMQYTR